MIPDVSNFITSDELQDIISSGSKLKLFSGSTSYSTRTTTETISETIHYSGFTAAPILALAGHNCSSDIPKKCIFSSITKTSARLSCGYAGIGTFTIYWIAIGY